MTRFWTPYELVWLFGVVSGWIIDGIVESTGTLTGVILILAVVAICFRVLDAAGPRPPTTAGER